MSRILLVDDDTAVSAGIRTILERNGCDVVIAPGHKGLEAIQTDQFDIVIVDIFMARTDGLETIRMFHKQAPTVPIIAVSGFLFRDSATPAPDFLSMATKLGAAYSFAKPFRPKDLLRAVKRCLAHEDDAPMPIATGDAMASSELQVTAGGAMANGEPHVPVGAIASSELQVGRRDGARRTARREKRRDHDR